MKRILTCLFALIASTAFATNSFTTACGTPPRAGSMDFPSWVDRLFAHGHTSCPLARTTTYYINQGTNNANAGTNPASPRNCATFTDLATFINASQGSGDVRFRLDQADTWRSVAATCTDKITISQPNVTIDSYDTSNPTGDATGRATLIGGAAMGGTGWTQDATYTNLYYKATSTANTRYVTWTTDTADEKRDFRRLTNTFRRYPPDTNANLAAGGGSFELMNTTAEDAFAFDTTNNRLYVRSTVGTWNSNIYLDQLHATEDCILVGGSSSTTVDGTRIDNLVFIGWGMASPASQKYAVRVDTGGSTMTGVTRCDAYFGSHHQIAMLASGSEVDGGYLWLDECTVGWCGKDGTSGATQTNFYSTGSGGEFISRNTRCRAGALKGWSTNATPGTGTVDVIYSHTDGSPDTIALMLSVGCGIDADATDPSGGAFQLGARGGNIDTSSLDTDKLDTTAYRCFEVSSTSQGNSFSHSGATPKIYVNCLHQIRNHPTASFTFMGSFFSANNECWINSILDIKDNNISGGSSFSFLDADAPASGSSRIHMVNSLWVMRTFYGPVRFCAAGEHTAYTGSRWYNSGVLGVHRTSATKTITNALNQAPSDSQGGCAGLIVPPNAQAATSGNDIGYDGTTSPIYLSYVPNEPGRLIGMMRALVDSGVSVGLPQLQVDYDMFFRIRGNDAGPTGGSGATGDVQPGRRRKFYIFD